MATQTLTPTRAGRYVTFQIAHHYFAIDARLVRQISPARDIQPHPHPMPLVRGIVPAKSRRVPVIDVRSRLGLPHEDARQQSTVIVIDLNGIFGLPLLGILVDRVSDVLEFRDRDFRDNIIQLRPHGRPFGRPKTLLDPQALLDPDELSALCDV